MRQHLGWLATAGAILAFAATTLLLIFSGHTDRPTQRADRTGTPRTGDHPGAAEPKPNALGKLPAKLASDTVAPANILPVPLPDRSDTIAEGALLQTELDQVMQVFSTARHHLRNFESGEAEPLPAPAETNLTAPIQAGPAAGPPAQRPAAGKKPPAIILEEAPRVETALPSPGKKREDTVFEPQRPTRDDPPRPAKTLRLSAGMPTAAAEDATARPVERPRTEKRPTSRPTLAERPADSPAGPAAERPVYLSAASRSSTRGDAGLQIYTITDDPRHLVAAQTDLDAGNLEQDSVKAVSSQQADQDQPTLGSATVGLPDDAPGASPEVVAPHRAAEVTAMPLRSDTPWQIEDSLLDDTRSLQKFEPSRLWAQDVESVLRELNQLERFDDPPAGALIEELYQLLASLSIYLNDQLAPAERNLTPAQESFFAQVSRFAYELQRRTEVWHTVFELASYGTVKPNSVAASTVSSAARATNNSLSAEPATQQWSEYLMLDKAELVFGDLQTYGEAHRRLLARKMLARVYAPTLTYEQRAYAEALLGDQMIDQLLLAASRPVEIEKFLKTLQEHEQQPTARSEFNLNDAYQDFFWSNDPRANQIATVLDGHYRNANFRIEVSDRLINRLLPEQPPYSEPVRDRIMGTDVTGQSQITNRLSIRLIPDPERLKFRLETLGLVRSRTNALHTQSGTVIDNLTNSRFEATKGVAIDRAGVSTDPTDVSASINQRVIGIRTRLDEIPLGGWLARRIVRQQHDAKAPLAQQQVEQKLKQTTQSRVDSEIDARLAEAQRQLDAQILQPLTALELEPAVIEMRTTVDRLIVRYRVAGRDQMAAHTARPRGVPDSMLSLQIHQSAINNLINNSYFNRSFTIDEFITHVNNLLGSNLQLDENVPNDIRFEFANKNAVRFDFTDDRITISLSMKYLQIGNGKRWQDLTVTASYLPEIDGLKVRLNLDPDTGVQMSGSRLNFRDQVAIRTVFNNVYQLSFEFPVVPQIVSANTTTDDMYCSQLAFSHGWVGVSISSRGPTVQAARQPKAWK